MNIELLIYKFEPYFYNFEEQRISRKTGIRDIKILYIFLVVFKHYGIGYN